MCVPLTNKCRYLGNSELLHFPFLSLQSLPNRLPAGGTPITTSGFIHRGRYRSDQRGVLYRTPGVCASPAGVGERGDGPGTAQPLPPEGTDGTTGQDGKTEPLDQVVGPSLTTPQRVSPLTPGLTVDTHPKPGGVCGAPPGSCVSGGDTEDVDPLVAKRRAMQRAKSQRLAMYSDNNPVTPLHSTISVKARKAFKMPTAARSASPALGRGKTGNESGPTEKGSKGVSQDTGEGENLGRKLSFDEDAERTDGQKKELGTPSMGEGENHSGDWTLNKDQSDRSSGNTKLNILRTRCQNFVISLKEFLARRHQLKATPISHQVGTGESRIHYSVM